MSNLPLSLFKEHSLSKDTFEHMPKPTSLHFHQKPLLPSCSP